MLYKNYPPFCMHYIIEWKLTLNRRIAAKQTEDDLIIAPSDFWQEGLSSTITDIVKSSDKLYKADATIIVISVNNRSEQDITKRFTELEIDWPVVKRQLQTWSHLLSVGKTLQIHALFNYVEVDKTARTAGRGATAA